jgi:hypothetical protein
MILADGCISHAYEAFTSNDLVPQAQLATPEPIQMPPKPTAPDVIGLIVARFGQLSRQREHERHRVFSDRAEIDSLRAGEPNVALCQLAAIELVGPGADRLNEAQALGALKQLVVPHA